MQEKMLSTPVSIAVTGFFVPFLENGQPCLITPPDHSNFWVAIFSTVDKLEESCAEFKIPKYKVKQISDGNEFLQSIFDAKIRVMLDPYLMKSENKTRWTEVKWS
jgi:hypothetical protein